MVGTKSQTAIKAFRLRYPRAVWKIAAHSMLFADFVASPKVMMSGFVRARIAILEFLDAKGSETLVKRIILFQEARIRSRYRSLYFSKDWSNS